MPTKISDKDGNEIVWFEGWELPEQIHALEAWLSENENKIEFGDYAADVGFSPRVEAAGGGASISLKSMKIMVKMGMVLYLSEYPIFADDDGRKK